MQKKIAQNNSNERMAEFIIIMLNSPRPVSLDSFKDPAKWGSESTFKKMRVTLNKIWEQENQCPFIETVNEVGIPTTRGPHLFLRLVDPAIRNLRSQRFAVMPAFMQLLQSLKGTILADEFKAHYEIPRKSLGKKEKAHLDRTDRKFYCFNKGAKDYSSQESKDIIDEVYDALLSEKLLQFTDNLSATPETKTLVPLSLIMFNSGLYLFSKIVKEDGTWTDKFYRYKVESLTDAKSLRKRPFTYPIDFDPQKLFEGEFGLMFGTKPAEKVILEFPAKSWVHAYLKERRWTGKETFTAIKGGSIRFTMAVTDMNEVFSWALPLAAEARIVAPDSLRDRVNEHFKKSSTLNI